MQKKSSRKRRTHCEALLFSLILIVEVMVAVLISEQAQADAASPALSMDSGCVVIAEQGWTLPVSLKCPEFVFDEQTVGTDVAPASAEGNIQDSCHKAVQLSFSPIDLGGSARLEIKGYLQWSPADRVLSKWARYRIVGTDTPLLLKEIVVERLQTPGQTPSVTTAVQSQPVLMQAFFAGVEFPVAAMRSESGRVVLAHRPGLRMQPGKWYETRKAVFGAAPVGREREFFQQYITNHRPGPKGFHVNYNSWWTTGVPYSEAEITGLMETFENKLYKPSGQRFDTFCIDMGWSNPHTFWDINATLFPQGFTPLQTTAARTKSSVGLWVSPSNFYSPSSMDNEWAKEQGYETFTQAWGSSTIRLCCLAGPKYSGDLRDRLVEMVRKYGVRHFKFDGYAVECPESDHGHEPGDYSAEAVADGIISVSRAIRQAAPDTWIETTCMGWSPSPWWLFYVNSVIGTYGDDAPYGRVPCPVYRESYTSARDYFNLQGAARLPIPIVAQEVLGIIHQSSEPFTNDAVTTVMRGHMFLPVYLNPNYMSDARWKAFAGILAWARKNAPALRQTYPLLPASWQNGNVPQFVADAVMPREVYGYAHCKNAGGLVMLRNPWITNTDYTLTLDESIGLKSGVSGLSVVSLYPEVRVYGQNLAFGDALSVPMVPYDTVVLSVGREQSTESLPTATSSLDGVGEVSVTRCEKARVEFSGDTGLFGSDWTSLVGDASSAVRLLLDAEVQVKASQAELVVLAEASSSPTTPTGHVLINGAEVQPGVTGSDTGWSATGHSMPENWVFLRYPLSQGTNTISMELYAGTESQTLSAWVLTSKPGSGDSSVYPNALPQPEEVRLESASLVQPFDTAAVTEPVVQAERPVTRINGIYLDAVEPTYCEQGWGTLQKNQSVWEKPMTIDGVSYLRGLGTHAVSVIRYNLGGSYARFESYAGADGATSPSVTFEVWVDGVKQWESGLMTRDMSAKLASLDITGKQTLELRVGDGGNSIISDHADWADAKLLR